MELKDKIVALEARPRNAMLNADTSELDTLLADDLLFTNHLGQLQSKQYDIQAHRSGLLTISALELDNLKIEPLGDTAIVTVQADIQGTYAGRPANIVLRFTRIWAKQGDEFQVIAAHASAVA
ncbi:nuclear transport factor 2 family protein [Bowmanella yangjiangensis]|uniref:Nuclear transport factor 2 family protein n=1 Tax=Bowmanella yangjiangensis TaxID=2811230 RepID=A0ABS3CZW6_9ALTE|nr:nuclear transport factor 2 family protein [Bowmanella yangjiangensis]MBN7821154.1 nuclear transport factor 2 family protein [Bowmanella yangjiangensis]